MESSFQHYSEEEYSAFIHQKLSKQDRKVLLKSGRLFLKPLGVHSHVHSQWVDRVLDIHTNVVEQKLLKKYKAYYKKEEVGGKEHFQGAQSWIGLHPQVLQTPYSELYHMMLELKKFNPKKIVDLGCGYGRMGLMLSACFPDAEFLGYEIVKPRIQEGRRVFETFGLNPKTIVDTNILDESFVLPEADVYFTYDFGNTPDIKRILQLILETTANRDFVLIARGKGVRSLIEIKFPKFSALHEPYRQTNWTLYQV